MRVAASPSRETAVMVAAAERYGRSMIVDSGRPTGPARTVSGNRFQQVKLSGS